MRLDACPSEQKLSAYQLGELPEAVLQDITAHLEVCPRCGTRARQPVLAATEVSAGTSPWPTRVLRTGAPTPVLGHEEAVAGPSLYPFLLPPVEPDEIGRLGNYRVLRLLGRGGMAFVFHAEDIALRRPVALKVMHPDWHNDAEVCRRFLREARIMASIKHEHLVTVYQAGQEGAVVYLAMELLEGESLGAWIDRNGSGDVAEILRLAREITSGLAVVHQHGLIHRDLKPDNIWREAQGGRVKILDFGLARFVEDDARLTQAGTIVGTPAFMSPEQARGEVLDARSDLFSLGGVLYGLCTGQAPFRAEHMMAVLTALAVDTPRLVHEVNPAIPRALSDLVMRLLAKDPDDRPASAAEVLDRLRRIEARPTGVPAAPVRSSARRAPSPERLAAGPGKAVLIGGVVAAGLAVALLAIAALATVKIIFPLIAAPAAPVPRAAAAAAVQPGAWPPARAEGRPAAEQPWDGLPPEAGPPPEEDRPPFGAGPPPIYPAVPGACYLSELQEIAAENWPFAGPLPPDGPPRPEFSDWPAPRGGRRVFIRGKAAVHGIWMHLPPPEGGVASITYRLGKQFSQFNTQVGLNDGPPECTPLTFAVYGDGRLLWQSRPVATPADLQSGSVPVQGVDLLKIEVSGRGSERGTHAAWIEPYLLK